MKKSVRKVLACSLAAALAVTGLGDFGVASAAAKTKKITMNTKTVLVKVKKTYKLKVASVKPAKASKKVTYKVANKKIATVSKKGVVKGKKVGTTTVKVTSKVNKKATAKVKVIVAKVVPNKVTLNKKKVELATGSSIKLKATIKNNKKLKKNAKTLTWTSNKKKVASVSKSGKVTAKTVGTAKITVATLNGKKATCTVTVTGTAVSGSAVTTGSATTGPATSTPAPTAPAPTAPAPTETPASPIKTTEPSTEIEGGTKYTVDVTVPVTIESGSDTVTIPTAVLSKLATDGIKAETVKANVQKFNDVTEADTTLATILGMTEEAADSIYNKVTVSATEDSAVKNVVVPEGVEGVKAGTYATNIAPTATENEYTVVSTKDAGRTAEKTVKVVAEDKASITSADGKLQAVVTVVNGEVVIDTPEGVIVK